MVRIALPVTLSALLGLTACGGEAPPVGAPPPPASVPQALPAPTLAVSLPESLAAGRTIGYAFDGLGYGRQTVAYRIDEVTAMANGGAVLRFTETAGEANPKSGLLLLSEGAFFDRGQALKPTYLRELGPEPVTVPAGTFETTKYVNTDGPQYVTVWVADALVVKVVQDDVGGDKPGTGTAELAFVR